MQMMFIVKCLTSLQKVPHKISFIREALLPLSVYCMLLLLLLLLFSRAFWPKFGVLWRTIATTSFA